MRVALICNTPSVFPLLDWLHTQKLLVGVGVKAQKTDFFDNLSVVCHQRGFAPEVLEKVHLADQLTTWIRAIGADLVLVLGFSYKIPKEVLAVPPLGFFNIHYGKLPQYGGSFPVFWQVKNQEKEGVLTIHQMDENYDTGPVAVEIPFATNADVSYGILEAQYGIISIQGVFQLIDSLLKNTLILKPQQPSRQPFYEKPTLNDLIIDWQKMDAHEILALIKASNPWNRGAFARINGIDVRIIDAKVSAFNTTKAGEVFHLYDHGVEVSCINNTAIDIKVIYSPYGYLSAINLGVLGIMNGLVFEQIEV